MAVYSFKSDSEYKGAAVGFCTTYTFCSLKYYSTIFQM